MPVRVADFHAPRHGEPRVHRPSGSGAKTEALLSAPRGPHDGPSETIRVTGFSRPEGVRRQARAVPNRLSPARLPPVWNVPPPAQAPNFTGREDLLSRPSRRRSAAGKRGGADGRRDHRARRGRGKTQALPRPSTLTDTRAPIAWCGGSARRGPATLSWRLRCSRAEAGVPGDAVSWPPWWRRCVERGSSTKPGWLLVFFATTRCGRPSYRCAPYLPAGGRRSCTRDVAEPGMRDRRRARYRCR